MLKNKFKSFFFKMEFEHLKRIFLVKNGFLLYNIVQILIIISIIYYVRSRKITE